MAGNAALSFAIKATNESGPALKALQQDLEGMSGKATLAVTALGGLAGGALGAGIGVLGDRAGKLDASMAKLSATTGATAEETKKLTDVVIGQSKSHLQSQEAIASTAEALISLQGIEAGNAKQVEKLTNVYLDYATATGQDAAGAVAAFDDVLDAWGLTAEDAAGIMDQLVVSHQKFGTDIAGAQSALNKYAPTFKTLGLNVNDAMGYINMFAASGVDAEASAVAFTKAMDNLTDSSSKGKDKLAGIAGGLGITGVAFDKLWMAKPDEKFRILTEAIAKTEDPAQRAQAAIELFGTKAGPKLAAALSASGGDLTQFQIDVNGAAGATEEAANKIEGTLINKLKLLSNQVMGTAQQMTQDFAPALILIGQLPPKVTAAIGGMIGSLVGLGPEMVKSGKAALVFAQNLSAAQLAIGIGAVAGVGLVASVFVLMGGLEGLTDTLGITSQAMRHFDEGARLASKTLGQLDNVSLTKLANGIRATQEDLSGFSLQTKAAENAFAGMVQQAVTQGATWEQVMKLVKDAGIENLPAVQEVLNKFKGDIDATALAATEAGAEFGTTVGGMKVAAVSELPVASQAFLDFKTNVETSIEGAQTSIQSLLPTIDEEFAKWAERLAIQAQNYINFQSNLEFILKALVDAHIKNPEQIIAALGKAGPDVTAAMKENLAEGGVNAASAVLATLSTIVGTDVQGMTDEVLARTPAFKAQMENTGLEGGTGFVIGFRSANMVAKMEEEFNKLPLAVRRKLESMSPSKVFQRIGHDTMQGYIIGLEEKRAELQDELRRVTELIVNTLDPDRTDFFERVRGKLLDKLRALVAEMQTVAAAAPPIQVISAFGPVATGPSAIANTPGVAPAPTGYGGIRENADYILNTGQTSFLRAILGGNISGGLNLNSSVGDWVINRLNSMFTSVAQMEAAARAGGYGLGGITEFFKTTLRAHGLAFDRGGWLPTGMTLAYNGTGRPERILAPGESGNITLNFYGLDVVNNPTDRRKVAVALRDEMLKVSR